MLSSRQIIQINIIELMIHCWDTCTLNVLENSIFVTCVDVPSSHLIQSYEYD